MKAATTIMSRLQLVVFALVALARIAQAGTDLAHKFVTPPDSAKPWVNMWWFDKVTPANITQHPEELKTKGVGGVMLIDLGNMPGAPYMSDKWRELFRHAVREAARLGLKLGVNTRKSNTHDQGISDIFHRAAFRPSPTINRLKA